MGSPSFEEMTLLISWEGGEPLSVRRVDQDGCGGQGPKRYLDTSVGDLVEEHVKHCVESHRMVLPTPVWECGFKLHPKTGGSLTCQLERHGDDTRHQFEL